MLNRVGINLDTGETIQQPLTAGEIVEHEAAQAAAVLQSQQDEAAAIAELQDLAEMNVTAYETLINAVDTDINAVNASNLAAGVKTLLIRGLQREKVLYRVMRRVVKKFGA